MRVYEVEAIGEVQPARDAWRSREGRLVREVPGAEIEAERQELARRHELIRDHLGTECDPGTADHDPPVG